MKWDGQMEHSSGFTIWFIGLSGAGKTTLAEAAAARLAEAGHKVRLLDGDVLRQTLSSDLGFSREDRINNAKRAGLLAQQLAEQGYVVLVSLITPYEESRQWLRANVKPYYEIYVQCPVEVCMQRDVKGLYKKALSGEIARFTGISDRFEEPQLPDLTLRTDIETVENCVSSIENLVKRIWNMNDSTKGDV